MTTTTIERHPPKIGLVVLKPLPGERRKSSHLIIVERRWRSKWVEIRCAGQAKACKAGECRHVQYFTAMHPRHKAKPMPTNER